MVQLGTAAFIYTSDEDLAEFLLSTLVVGAGILSGIVSIYIPHLHHRAYDWLDRKWERREQLGLDAPDQYAFHWGRPFWIDTQRRFRL
jgi:hypothetical protein